jgi:hypothetical protein
MAQSIVTAMRDGGVRRLIWISSMGIHEEVPGGPYGSILEPYRRAARVVETQTSTTRSCDPVVHERGRGRLRDDAEGRALPRPE